MLGHVLSLTGVPVYLLVGTLAFLESAAFVGLFAPGETALFLGGVVASHGGARLSGLLVVAIAGAIAGDSVGYEVGRCGGAALKTGPLGRLVGEQQWSRGERCVQRRGGLAILLGRWVGVLRALVPVVAGMGRMPYPRFLAFNALGGVPWVTTVVLGGYFAGGSFQHLEGPSGRGGVALLAVPVVALALPLAWRCLVLFRRHVAAADIDRRPAAPEAH